MPREQLSRCSSVSPRPAIFRGATAWSAAAVLLASRPSARASTVPAYCTSSCSSPGIVNELSNEDGDEVLRCCAPRRCPPAASSRCRSAALAVPSPARSSSRRASIRGAAPAASRRSTTSSMRSSPGAGASAARPASMSTVTAAASPPRALSGSVSAAAPRGLAQAREGSRYSPCCWIRSCSSCPASDALDRRRALTLARAALWEAWQEQQARVELAAR
jgi:hypothetical protein